MLWFFKIKEKELNQNIDESNKNDISEIKKADVKDDNNSEDSMETKKKIVETITESAVKNSKLILINFGIIIIIKNTLQFFVGLYFHKYFNINCINYIISHVL